jgi:hypothetical protein
LSLARQESEKFQGRYDAFEQQLIDERLVAAERSMQEDGLQHVSRFAEPFVEDARVHPAAFQWPK